MIKALLRNPTIQGQLRHGLTTVGGLVAASTPLLSDSMVQGIVGLIMVTLGHFLSYKDKQV